MSSADSFRVNDSLLNCENRFKLRKVISNGRNGPLRGARAGRAFATSGTAASVAALSFHYKIIRREKLSVAEYVPGVHNTCLLQDYGLLRAGTEQSGARRAIPISLTQSLNEEKMSHSNPYTQCIAAKSLFSRPQKKQLHARLVMPRFLELLKTQPFICHGKYL